MIDKAELDVVAVATMQYWHALPTIWACQAGKDVYVEKPLSHYIREGHSWSAPPQVRPSGTDRHAEPVDPLRNRYDSLPASGHLGKIHYVTAFANKPEPRSANAPRRCRSPTQSIMTSGAVRPTMAPSFATAYSTTAASPGTRATANRATRASTRSTWHAGC